MTLERRAQPALLVAYVRRAGRTLQLWAEMVKLSHSIFALPFALIAAFLATRAGALAGEPPAASGMEGRGWPSLGQLGLIVVCMVAARSVAMTFNRIVDAKIDARNPRTAGRLLAVDVRHRGRTLQDAERTLPDTARTLQGGALRIAWIMLGLSAVTFGIGSLGFEVFYGNSWPILLSGPVLIYLCGYSFTKRFTKWSHYYLGSALALSPLAVWLAIHPESVGLPVVLLMITVTGWVAGFDIIYACQDIEVDRKEGLHSLPSRLGPRRALWIARGSHLIAVAGLVALGVVADLGMIYGAGVGLAAILLLVENSLVHPGDYSKVNVAFFTLNGAVSAVLAAAVIADVLL